LGSGSGDERGFVIVIVIFEGWIFGVIDLKGEGFLAQQPAFFFDVFGTKEEGVAVFEGKGFALMSRGGAGERIGVFEVLFQGSWEVRRRELGG